MITIQWVNEKLEQAAYAIWQAAWCPLGRHDEHYAEAILITPTEGTDWVGWVNGVPVYTIHHGVNSFVLYAPSFFMGCETWKDAADTAAAHANKPATVFATDIPMGGEFAADVTMLSEEDQKLFAELRTMMGEHLRSDQAFCLWLNSDIVGYQSTPLDAIRRGYMRQVLEAQRQQLGPAPAYS